MASDRAVRGQCRTSPSARADGLTSRISQSAGQERAARYENKLHCLFTLPFYRDHYFAEVTTFRGGRVERSQPGFQGLMFA